MNAWAQIYNTSITTLRVIINKWDLLKLRSFYKAKNTANKTKRQPTEWKEIFINPTSDKGLIFKIYKKLRKLDIKIPIKKWSTVLNKEFSTEESQIVLGNGGIL